MFPRLGTGLLGNASEARIARLVQREVGACSICTLTALLFGTSLHLSGVCVVSAAATKNAALLEDMPLEALQAELQRRADCQRLPQRRTIFIGPRQWTQTDKENVRREKSSSASMMFVCSIIVRDWCRHYAHTTASVVVCSGMR